MRRLLTTLVAILVGCLVLSGCSFSIYDLPLPGGAKTGASPTKLHVQFRDVLDLVPDSTVKLNDVTVGKVEKVTLDHGVADVEVAVQKSVKLPANTTAEIQQTSLLGEKFVALKAPTDGTASTALMKSGDTIPLARTGANPEVEQVLGALSLILNGGGVAQLHTISTELNKALAGHEDAARSVLTQVDLFAKNLDEHKQAITDALDAVAKLSATAKSQEKTIDATLEELPGALSSIDQQRHDLVTMLQALSKLGDTGVRVISASKQGTIDIIKNLQPVLTSLARSGDHFVSAFNTLLTYPFVDAAVGGTPQAARNLHMGDFVNLDMRLNLDFSDILDVGSLVPSAIAPGTVLNEVLGCIRSLSLTSQKCIDVLASVKALAQLKSECLKTANSKTAVCKLLNMIPGLPNLTQILPKQLSNLLGPVLGAGTTSGGTTSGGGTGSSGSGGGLLGLGALGLRQQAPAAERAGVSYGSTAHGPTYGALSALYDPSLVALLVPPLTAPTGGAR
ncbi:MCE family protein [Nocardioides nematodiphilus]|uniref:MCE family protein n=1 Tax=Nocardioides nematodiphilus TaxID=2849669 RepID=UPI001CDA4AE0|nr:MCE family protein [Nocardioides nematodiphilus]MCA1984316.1 MCE family protein [Nocardioides nematodiphilus]